MFDLDKAVGAWRRAFEQNRVFSTEDVEELERHLRDHTADLVRRGRAEAEAFEEARRRVGDFGSTEKEYRKLFWKKRRHRRTILNELTWRLAMLRSYLVVMFRTLRRQKGYAFINILGLTLGLTTCLIIGLYVRHELSYDRYHPTADRVFRIYQESEPGTGTATTPNGLTKALEDRYPEIEQATLVGHPRRRLIAQGDERFYLEDVVVADDNFLHVFPFRLLHGHPDRVLSEPNQMVLTQSTARQLFGTNNPVGETLTIENEHTYTVAGVIENVPTNSHFRFNALFSLDEQARQDRQSSDLDWNRYGSLIYLKLHEGSDATSLEEKIRAFEAEGRKQQGFRYTEPKFRLQPLTEAHLYLDLSSDIAPQSDIRYLFLFSGIGLIILLIACINYMNLATARSLDRAREVGVRKVVGAQRGQLAGQFLGESVLTAFLTLPFSVMLAALALPAVNAITGQELTLRPLLSWPVALSLLGLVLGIGVLAGSYPAFFLSRYRPSVVLMGRSRSMGRSGLWLRQTLVLFQFAATIVLLIGTLVVQFQLDYIRNKPLGFNQEHVVTLEMPHEEQYGAFKEALLSQSTVLSASAGPPPGIGWKNMIMVLKDEETQEGIGTIAIAVDYGYLETTGMKLLAGRDFDRTRGTDSDQSILITPSVASQYGLPDNPVGQTITIGSGDRTVIGTIDEVINESLLDQNWPIMIQLQPGYHNTTLVRLRPGSIKEGLADIESVWKQFVPDRPFEFEFLDERIAAQYDAEQRLGYLSLLLTGLAILVACLGLFGLAAFTAEHRTKEIGIRKVMGASVANIVGLLSRRFLALVCIALLVATPLAYLAMSKWLENFAYHIEIGPSIFVLAGALALLIALITVSFQSIKAALTNPARSLRYE